MKRKLSFAIVFFIIGSFVASYIIYVASKEALRNRRIEKEIESLKMEMEDMRVQNNGLKEEIAYYDSSEFREFVAKAKLNLKKEDEQVVEIKPTITIKKETKNEELKQPVEILPEDKNYMKWWKQFFSI